MKQLRCPVNGLRPLQEFTYGGEYRPMPNPDETSDKAWADYIFNRDGDPGLKREWWYHNASDTWFLADRNTKTDEIVATFLYEELKDHE